MTSPPTDHLARTLAELADGRELRPADILGLADLGRAETRTLRQHWPRLPDPVRLALAALIHQRSAESIEEDYEAVATVALDDVLPAVRRFGVQALWESTDRGAGERLLHLFEEDEEESVRTAAAKVLGRFVLDREFGRGDQEWGDRLVAALRTTVEDQAASIDLRSSALTSLAPRSEPWVASILREAYYDEDRDYRLACVVAMGLTAQPMWLDYLYEQLQSEDPDFRRVAAIACGEIADEDAVDPLGDTLDDEDATVVAAAVGALAEIGGELATEYLEAFRRRVPEELADSLEEAISIAREAEAGERDDERDEEDEW